MKTQLVRVPGAKPLLDIVSHGRGGPYGWLTPGQIEHIRRTVHRVPEVMVKVLSNGSSDLQAVARHVDYINRHGQVPLETDDGYLVNERFGKGLINDWDLDIDDLRRSEKPTPTNARKPAKLVHKLMFSMPAGTPPAKVLEAVRNFAREEFALKHRYAFVLHTDEPHPHVHMIVKAVSEQGIRLNITKQTLRQWRSQFAYQMRALGVEANATERAVRGKYEKARKDGIYRAASRGASTFLRHQVESAVADLVRGELPHEPGRVSLSRTRQNVEQGWLATARVLADGGHQQLADDVLQFVANLPAPKTEREIILGKLRQHVKDPRSMGSRVR